MCSSDGVNCLRGVILWKEHDEIQIADCFAPAPQRARGGNRFDLLAEFLDMIDQLFRGRFGGVDEESSRRLIENCRGLDDVLLALLAEAG